MQKQASFGIPSNPITEATINASRQVWLAGLGAAAVTRDWARTEAGKTFRSLVKEGSAVETKAIRDLSKRVETSVATATSLWKQTRATTMTAANTIAQNASAVLSKFKTPIVVRSAPAKARKAAKATKKSATSTTRRTKRATRKA
jgi:Poly(hydroxyalcanoate) granule associated protein (phasin)